MPEAPTQKHGYGRMKAQHGVRLASVFGWDWMVGETPAGTGVAGWGSLWIGGH